MDHPGRPASWSARVSAALLDGLIVSGLGFVLAIVMVAILGLSGSLMLLTVLVAAGAYYAGSMSRPGTANGQTLGRQSAGIRVVRDDGRPVTLGSALQRDVVLKGVLAPLTLGLDFLWPLGNEAHRSLHDVAAGTRVVDVRPAPAPWRPPLALSPALGRYVHAAQTIEREIFETVRRAQLPYGEVCVEVHALVGLVCRSAERAQPLLVALHQRPVASIERRLWELRGSGKTELIDSLRNQLTVQRRMQ